MKAKTKEKQNKPFYKKWWFWLIVGLILCGNVAVLIWVQSTDLKANLLTVISGWISGIATFIIGFIAYKQNEKYQLENKRQNLLSDITNFASDFQSAYVNYINVDKIIDLCFKQKNLFLASTEEKIKLEYEINNDSIFLLKQFRYFESVLMKANYCADQIITLHKAIKVMEESDIFSAQKKENDNYINIEDDTSTKITCVLNWMHEVDKLANQIILEYHELQLKILKNAEIKGLYNSTIKEGILIVNYFKKVSKENNDGQVENGK